MGAWQCPAAQYPGMPENQTQGSERAQISLFLGVLVRKSQHGAGL